MEKALLNGKEIFAFEVSKDYEYEKSIRKVSGKKLLCPDENCTNRILKYCHGDKKQAYFAHICNSDCSYERYEKETTEITRDTKRNLYQHLFDKGYNIQMDVKLVEGHYTHLVINDNGTQYPIEILSKFSSARQIEHIKNLYGKSKLNVNWVVTDIDAHTPMYIVEDEINFAKRFSLNETDFNGLLTINVNDGSVTQYKMDTNEYTFDGCFIDIPEFPSIFSISRSLESLIFENGRLTLSEFDKEYKEFSNKKQEAYVKWTDRLQKDKENRIKRAMLINELQKRQIEAKEKEQRAIEETKLKKAEERKRIIAKINEVRILTDDEIVTEINKIDFPPYNPMLRDQLKHWDEEYFKQKIKEIETKPDIIKFILIKLRYGSEEEKQTFKAIYQQKDNLYSAGTVYALRLIAKQLKEGYSTHC